MDAMAKQTQASPQVFLLMALIRYDYCAITCTNSDEKFFTLLSELTVNCSFAPKYVGLLQESQCVVFFFKMGVSEAQRTGFNEAIVPNSFKMCHKRPAAAGFVDSARPPAALVGTYAKRGKALPKAFWPERATVMFV